MGADVPHRVAAQPPRRTSATTVTPVSQVPYDRPVRVERRAVGEQESRAANGPDWDRYADEYQATHGPYLGDAGFLWGPEGLTEDEAGVLGGVAGKGGVGIGGGGGPGSPWGGAHGGRGLGGG